MTTITTEQTLTYEVVFTRDDGERWPLLERQDRKYDIREVTVTVTIFEGGTFNVDFPDARRGNRVRQDGTRGARIPRFLGYYSEVADDQVAKKADWFRTEALRIARHRLALLTSGGLELKAS
jgi:hypothetical protein